MATVSKQGGEPVMAIRWEPPSPRKGKIAGGFDQFIGPGATAAEIVLQFGGALICAIFLVGHFYQANVAIQQQQQPQSNDDLPLVVSTTQLLLVFLLAIDMVGGVITNATSAAKAWYHRSSQTPMDHLGFVAIHAMQIGCVSWTATPTENRWKVFGAIYGYIMLSSMVILFVTPLYVQRPMAMFFVTLAIPFGYQMEHYLPVGLEWFVPLLSIKLLISHLIKEAPFQPTTTNLEKQEQPNGVNKVKGQ